MHRGVLIDCLPFLAMIVVCVFVGRVLLTASGWRVRLSAVRNLHRDQRGAVQSLSFVLTLPIFVTLMLFIVQLSQLTIGRISVEYAAFAAARSASVWIPADLGDHIEGPNCVGIRSAIGEVRDENGNIFTAYEITHPSRKLQKVELAAAMALMPICPSRGGTSAGDHVGLVAAPSIEKAYFAMSPDSVSNTRIPTRLRNKLSYALENTDVDIEVRHRHDEPPLDPPPIPPIFERNEIGWQDQILVTVTHDFALLPGPARFLSKRLPRPGQTTDEVADRIRNRGNVFVYTMTATVRLSNEGEKPAIAYTQPWPIERLTRSVE